MWWLTRRVRGADPEQGAIAALVAIMLTAGVLVGMGALVVDAGQIYAARAQMQNGADAAALKIAQACAEGPVGVACLTNPNDPATTAYGVANSYATKNAGGGASHVTAVCGSGSAVLTTNCPGDRAELYCPNQPATGNYVEVHTKTGADSTKTLLPPAFGRALLGGSYSGKVVGACAQASWGPVGAATAPSITFSLCTWKAATTNGTTFAPPPNFIAYPVLGYPTWPPVGVAGYTGTPPAAGAPGGEQVLETHGSGNDCAGSPGSGWQLPGGFGWLDDAGGNCKNYTDITVTYHDNTGNDWNPSCQPTWDNSIAQHAVVYLPIFDGISGTGNNGIYHMAGFAAFVVTGGYFKGQGPPWSVKSSITNKNYCSGSLRCIYGFFTQGLIPAGAVPSSGTNFGARGATITG